MPQMSPMWWTLLMMSSTMTMYLTMMNVYFLKSKKKEVYNMVGGSGYMLMW